MGYTCSMDTKIDSKISPQIALNPMYKGNEFALLQALLQATDTAILMSGLDRQDIIANRRMGELFSVTPQDIVELDPILTRQLAYDRVRDSESFIELLDKTYNNPELSYQDEIELLSIPTTTLLRFTGPVYNSECIPIARLWTFQDITETKLLQKEIQDQLDERTQEFQETSNTLHAINALCQLTIEHSTSHETISSIIQILQTLLFPEYVAILLTDDLGMKYEGLEWVQENGISEIVIPIKPDLEDAIVRQTKEYMQFNLENRPEIIDQLLLNRLNCAINHADLISNNRKIGLVIIGGQIITHERDRLRAMHIQAVIDQVSLTIENHKLQQNLRLTLDRLRSAHDGMVEMEKLHIAGALAASVAHDIRNILTAMQCELDAEPSLASAEMRFQVNRFTSLTHHLLAFSRPAALNTTPIQLAEVISKVIPLISGQAAINGIEIVVDIPTNFKLIAADSSQLIHLFVNLCLNAIQAMTTNGGSLIIRGYDGGDQQILEIGDTGIGISADTMEKLFNPFFTTRANGFGLGLFSCKKIVEEHGGHICVQSEPGIGTVFNISFPALP